MVLTWKSRLFLFTLPIKMPGLFSRIRGKDGKPKSKKNGYADSSPQLLAKPRWEDAYARTSVEPEEVQDLVNRCTVELKARGKMTRLTGPVSKHPQATYYGLCRDG